LFGERTQATGAFFLMLLIVAPVRLRLTSDSA
jgi:hypothetical protein